MRLWLTCYGSLCGAFNALSSPEYLIFIGIEAFTRKMITPSTIDWITEMGRPEIDADVLLAGVDEAGRGPLAGPVVAAAVILDPARPIAGLADSKRLTAKVRERLAVQIRDHALAWALGSAGVEEIDRFNILQATLRAMQRAVEELSMQPQHVLIDGNHCPPLEYSATAIVRGDARVAQISAASILAKVARDREMCSLDSLYPEYGFSRHKGYPTPAHLDALRRYGPCPCHRQSFAPVRALLKSSNGLTFNDAL
jgi:ribonuclease HII